jgi:thiamine transport system ATP-binding protein
VLSITDLCLTYQLPTQNELSLFCFNLSLNQGDWVAISGPSGVGKSSLLMALAGLIPIDSGHIYWQNQHIEHLPAAKRPIAMLFQDNNLFRHLSIEQNLKLAQKAALPEHSNTQDQLSDIYLWAKRFKIEPLLSKMPAELSGGQQQRASIVRALLQRKPILLLDEPLTGLDARLREASIRWFEELNQTQGLTLIMITHHPEELPITGVNHFSMQPGGALRSFNDSQ